MENTEMSILARVIREGVIVQDWTYFTLESVGGCIYAIASFGSPNNELQTLKEFEVELEDGRKCAMVITKTITDLITNNKTIVFTINDEMFLEPNIS